MHKTLKYAAISGILSLIILIPQIVFAVLNSLNKFQGNLMSLYILVLFASLILYIVLIWGFKIIGERYQNNLLKIGSYLLIIAAIIVYGCFVLALAFPILDNIVVSIIEITLLGAATIPFGIGLLRLKVQFGGIATAAGVIEIISGISFLTVLLSPIGILLSIPDYILAVIILFRAAKKLKAQSQVVS